jgi:hypothetical protein
MQIRVIFGSTKKLFTIHIDENIEVLAENFKVT